MTDDEKEHQIGFLAFAEKFWGRDPKFLIQNASVLRIKDSDDVTYTIIVRRNKEFVE